MTGRCASVPLATRSYDDASRFCPRDGEPLPGGPTADERHRHRAARAVRAPRASAARARWARSTAPGSAAWSGRSRSRSCGASSCATRAWSRASMREARAVAKLQHPNIVTVLLVGETDDGVPFLAMEYVDGEALAERAARRERVARAAALAAHRRGRSRSALAEAHAEGIVHRDLKPANILLTRRGACPTSSRCSTSASPRSLRGEAEAPASWRAGSRAPGRSSGRRTTSRPSRPPAARSTRRADLYSLGVILYRLADRAAAVRRPAA